MPSNVPHSSRFRLIFVTYPLMGRMHLFRYLSIIDNHIPCGIA
jgi:hypothetical protein